MASLIPHDFVPLEMLVTIHSRKYPDLAEQLEKLCISEELTPLEAQDKIRQTVNVYEMYLANGRIKPKTQCS